MKKLIRLSAFFLSTLLVTNVFAETIKLDIDFGPLDERNAVKNIHKVPIAELNLTARGADVKVFGLRLKRIHNEGNLNRIWATPRNYRTTNKYFFDGTTGLVTLRFKTPLIIPEDTTQRIWIYSDNDVRLGEDKSDYLLLEEVYSDLPFRESDLDLSNKDQTDLSEKENYKFYCENGVCVRVRL